MKSENQGQRPGWNMKEQSFLSAKLEENQELSVSG